MKKLLLLLSLVLIASCSSSDDEEYYHDKNYFNPPTWSQGIWKNESGITLTVYRDNVILKSPSSTVSFNDYANDISRSGGYVNVTESINSNNYTFIFAYGKNYEDDSIVMKFIRVSNNEIRLEGFLNGAVFIRQ